MKKLMNLFTLVLMLTAFLGASILMGQEWSKEQKEVWKVVESGWEAWSKGDTDGAFNTIHDKYLGWNNDDALPMSKAKWMKMYNMYKEMSTVDYFDLNPARILVDGNNAAVYYYFEFYSTFKKGDKVKENHMEGRNVEFYVKQNGQWMLFGDMTYFDEDDD